MSDVKTIDQRIREQARTEYREQLLAATSPIRKFFEGTSGGAETNIPNPAKNGHPFWAGELLDAIEGALFKRFVAVKEEAAVEAFLTKVESLSDQIEELRSEMVGGN